MVVLGEAFLNKKARRSHSSKILDIFHFLKPQTPYLVEITILYEWIIIYKKNIVLLMMH